MRPYSTWAASSSPWTSLSRTAAQLASFDTVTLRPYFLYRPSSEAITTLAQSVSGMKPMVRSVFSGLPKSAAKARCDSSTGAMPLRARPPADSSERLRKTHHETTKRNNDNAPLELVLDPGPGLGGVDQ